MQSPNAKFTDFTVIFLMLPKCFQAQEKESIIIYQIKFNKRSLKNFKIIFRNNWKGRNVQIFCIYPMQFDTNKGSLIIRILVNDNNNYLKKV